MGYDLHWKVTPQPPPEEETFGFEDGFFCDLWGIEWNDRRNLEGKQLGKDDLHDLKLIIKTLDIIGGQREIIMSIQAMITAIEKHGSITIGGAS